MLKLFPILISFLAVACIAKNKKQAPATVYDETALKDFVLTTTDSNKNKSIEVLDATLKDASKDSIVFYRTVIFLERAFGNPNSAFRNENLYSTLLQAKMKSEWIDSIAKATTRERLYLLMQNRPRTTANDFTYTTAAGFKKKMFDVRADYTLLFFYNPECDACKEMKAALINSNSINKKIKTGELKILAVYTDKDEKIWLDHLNEMPEDWIHGRDEDEYLFKNSVYNLKAIPTVYLLDKEKKVVLKDCVDVTDIEEKLKAD
jgi:hypothetical protein